MEVLSSSKNESAMADLGGASLIQTIVSLTDLPEPLVHREMDDIIKASGHQSESLTLEQLRLAMLSYLESIQADMQADISQSDESSVENDANELKASVFFE